MSKEEKKNWKETQRDRQIKQQRAEHSHQVQRQREEKKKHRKFPLEKLFFGVTLVILVLTAYGVWQFYEGQKPPVIGGVSASVSEPQEAAPDFSLIDINGTRVSLSQFGGRVIGIHFMAVGCHGQINPINEYQLTQLRSVCDSVCGEGNITFLTVAVATCESSDLDVLRNNYGVSWILGNDYADETLDIVNAYVPYEIGDGAIVLIDKTFNIAQVYNGGVAAETLAPIIGQLAAEA